MTSEARLQVLEQAAKSLDAKVGRLEKISDHNAQSYRDVSVALSCEVSVIRMVLEDLVRGDTKMKSIGKIDFDYYLHRYNREVEEEIDRRKAEDEAAKAKELVSASEQEDEPVEFGGDYGKDARTG